MKRALAVIALLLLVAAGLAVAWVWSRTRTHDVRGSSTVEFVTTEEPATETRPEKVVADTPWPLYGYDEARTRVAAQFRLRAPFHVLWTVRLGNTIEFPPVVAYEALYVNQIRGRFFKIRVTDGHVLWRKHFFNCSAASPAVGNKIVYVALMQRYPCRRYPRTQRGAIVALRVRGGKQLWRYNRVGAVESSPLLVGKTLYFGSWDHSVYSLAVGGKRPVLKWRFAADGEVNTSPAFAGGQLFFGTDAGSVYALDARTGRLRWRSQSFSHFPRGREYFYASPAIAYGRVYIGNTDGTMYAYGASTGRLLWARHVGTYVYTAAAVRERRVYIGTYDGKFLALNAATGDVLWTYNAPAAIHGAPAIVGNLVFFSTCGRCGENGSRGAKSGPRVTIALDAGTGREVWSFPDGQYSPVVADEHRLYLVGRTRVYGLGPVRAAAAERASKKSHAKTKPRKGHAK